jgi:hypothetical protein
VEAKLVEGKKYGELANAVKARNEAVHRKVSVHKSDAVRYVKTILEVVGQLPPEEAAQ